MKIRTDYVTNSSSSSFVIAYREPAEVEPDVLAKYPWMKFYKRMIEALIAAEDSCGDTSEGIYYNNQEEYDKYFIENYGWRGEKTVEDIINKSDNSYERNKYEKIAKFFADGYSIITKYIDYSDDGLRSLIYEIGKDNDDFIVIEDE